jgi:hypothetical protein
MELEVSPPVDDVLTSAVRDLLAEEREPEPLPPAWKRAALTEGVEREESYALSPRSTRGATRA